MSYCPYIQLYHYHRPHLQKHYHIIHTINTSYTQPILTVADINLPIQSVHHSHLQKHYLPIHSVLMVTHCPYLQQQISGCPWCWSLSPSWSRLGPERSCTPCGASGFLESCKRYCLPSSHPHCYRMSSEGACTSVSRNKG